DFIVANAGNVELALDVASGPGILTCALAKTWQNAKIYGIDLSTEMIEYSKRKAEKKKCNNVEFVHGNALAMPFADRKFDVIVCRGFLKVVSERRKLLAECERVLKESGVFFFSDTYFEGMEILAKVCRNPEEFGVLEEAVKHSLKLREVIELFSAFKFSLYVRGISVYVMGRRKNAPTQPL
ncbi:MAG: class I SAM-dependent methyltransferase, partial [Thermoplasmata archaeon]